ncbi:MAG: hypothetical protein H0V53_00450 [Rubrobacter sp.]|nr:hypothetical protein [Rubrobacter sp.]
MRFFEALNRPVVVVPILVVILLVTVFSFYRYQSQIDASAPGQSNTVPEENGGTNGVSAQSEAAFVHRATAENTSGNSTYLDSPLAEEDPEAVLLVTQNWNPEGGAGTYNDHPVGVWYDPDAQEWAIFNQDLAAMPDGASFNVLVLPDSGQAR